MNEPRVEVGLIWAQAANGVIGARGVVPWHLPEDLTHFRQATSGAAVIMGRRTWESLPERFRPLPGRRNIVLTRSPGWTADGAQAAAGLEEALASVGPGADAWIIGGAQDYREALPLADLVVRTELEQTFDGDVVAPALDERWRLVQRDPESGWHTSRTGLRYRFSTWAAPTHDGTAV